MQIKISKCKIFNKRKMMLNYFTDHNSAVKTLKKSSIPTKESLLISLNIKIMDKNKKMKSK
jgi:hypothetical protein